MSFNNYADDLERASVASNRYKDYPEFEQLSSGVDARLHRVNELLLSPPVNDTDVADQFKQINDQVRQLLDLLEKMEKDKEDIEVVRYLRQKEGLQMKLIREALGRFQRVRNTHTTSEANTLTSQAENGGAAQVQINYEPINAEELEQQLLAIRQREQEIHRIHQDTMEINEIFDNLLSVVNQQQFQIDNIEENLFNYSSDVRGAHQELRRAERYQKRTGGRMCYCLMILLGLLALILFIVII